MSFVTGSIGSGQAYFRTFRDTKKKSIGLVRTRTYYCHLAERASHHSLLQSHQFRELRTVFSSCIDWFIDFIECYDWSILIQPFPQRMRRSLNDIWFISSLKSIIYFGVVSPLHYKYQHGGVTLKYTATRTIIQTWSLQTLSFKALLSTRYKYALSEY